MSKKAQHARKDADRLIYGGRRRVLSAGRLCAMLQKKRELGNTELKKRVTAYIDGHIEAPELYADTVAQACGLSVKCLHRIFHEHTGKSVCDYIEEKRMQRARRMLEEGGVNISQISGQCGFRSLNTFYKAFKRVNGTSPSEYRRRAAEQAEQSRARWTAGNLRPDTVVTVRRLFSTLQRQKSDLQCG